MSSNARAAAARLVAKYTLTFDVPRALIVVEPDGPDCFAIFAPSVPAAPRWTTGVCP